MSVLNFQIQDRMASQYQQRQVQCGKSANNRFWINYLFQENQQKTTLIIYEINGIKILKVQVIIPFPNTNIKKCLISLKSFPQIIIYILQKDLMSIIQTQSPLLYQQQQKLQQNPNISAQHIQFIEENLITGGLQEQNQQLWLLFPNQLTTYPSLNTSVSFNIEINQNSVPISFSDLNQLFILHDSSQELQFYYFTINITDYLSYRITNDGNVTIITKNISPSQFDNLDLTYNFQIQKDDNNQIFVLKGRIQNYGFLDRNFNQYQTKFNIKKTNIQKQYNFLLFSEIPNKILVYAQKQDYGIQEVCYCSYELKNYLILVDSFDYCYTDHIGYNMQEIYFNRQNHYFFLNYMYDVNIQNPVNKEWHLFPNTIAKLQYPQEQFFPSNLFLTLRPNPQQSQQSSQFMVEVCENFYYDNSGVHLSFKSMIVERPLRYLHPAIIAAICILSVSIILILLAVMIKKWKNNQIVDIHTNQFSKSVSKRHVTSNNVSKLKENAVINPCRIRTRNSISQNPLKCQLCQQFIANNSYNSVSKQWCGHNFHKKCLNKQSQQQCPICAKNISLQTQNPFKKQQLRE